MHTLPAPCKGMCPLPGSIPTTALGVSFAVSVFPKLTGPTRAAVDAAIPMDTDGLQLPSLSAIQAAKTATIRHVPSAARHAWAQVLTRALAAAAHRNDDKAWRELCMLPKCVLCAPPPWRQATSKSHRCMHLGPLASVAGGGKAIPLGIPHCFKAGAWLA